MLKALVHHFQVVCFEYQLAPLQKGQSRPEHPVLRLRVSCLSWPPAQGQVEAGLGRVAPFAGEVRELQARGRCPPRRRRARQVGLMRLHHREGHGKVVGMDVIQMEISETRERGRELTCIHILYTRHQQGK